MKKEANYTRCGFVYAAFKITFTLPDAFASYKISVQYKEGVLTVHLPKIEEAKEKPTNVLAFHKDVEILKEELKSFSF